MPFLKNFWYCVAWADELADNKPIARTILGEKLVIFRGESGKIAAISNVCSHRFAPLNEGTVVGDTIMCRYHGLKFGTDGVCVHNPHGHISEGQRVVAYSIVERYAAVWIWMGDAEPDESLIPVLLGHDEPGWRTVSGSIHVKGGYELVSDNLLDLSHTQYLHSFLTMEDDGHEHQFDVTHEGNSVRTHEKHLGAPVFPFLQFVWPDSPERVDCYGGVRWEAPANMLLKVHFAKPGQPEAEGIHAWGGELITPETETSCHYFWSIARDYRLDDVEFEKALAGAVSGVFTNEDAWMIGLIQENMGEATDLLAMHPAILATDGAAVRARRIVRRLLREQDARSMAAE